VADVTAFTDPEIAWVGLTEDEAKKSGTAIGVAKFPWIASGRAIANARDEGFTKLIFDAENHRLVGGGIVGTGAGDLISELALAVEMGATPPTSARPSIRIRPSANRSAWSQSSSRASAPTCRRRRSDEMKLQGLRRVLVCLAAIAAASWAFDASATTCLSWSGYEVSPDAVVYRTGLGSRVLSIDPQTFQDLMPARTAGLRCAAGYARDARTVVYEGRPLLGAHAKSFQVLDDGWGLYYAKDRRRVYAGGKPISDDVASFQVLGGGYATDGKHGFYGSVRLPGRNFTMPVPGSGYAKTDSAVFVHGKVLSGIDPASFQVFENSSYARDRTSVLVDGEVIPGADPATFEVLAAPVRHARDRRHVYYGKKVVEGADPASIAQISNYYFRDARAVFLEGWRVPDADPATFKVPTR